MKKNSKFSKITNEDKKILEFPKNYLNILDIIYFIFVHFRIYQILFFVKLQRALALGM